MSEKRFTLNLMKKPSEIEMDGKMISKYDVVRLLNGLSEENEQLKKQLSEYDEPKISIFNKDKGDWKWNDNNDIILNIRNGKSFYLRNSGAVENLVGLLNEQQATNDYLEESNSRLQIQLGETLRLVDEQQATIRKLQDLCGKSDGENAKLREEVNLLRPTNLEQYEQIQKLQEENEQLQAQIREKEQDEQLYANEIVKLNKEAKEVLDFKSLGGDY